MRYKMILAVVVAGVLCGVARAEDKVIKVLAVGNSFSANALRYFGDIVKASGNRCSQWTR